MLWCLPYDFNQTYSGETPEWGLASLASRPVWGERDPHRATEGCNNYIAIEFLASQDALEVMGVNSPVRYAKF